MDDEATGAVEEAEVEAVAEAEGQWEARKEYYNNGEPHGKERR